MEDIGITAEQFEEACNRENHEPIPVQFEQVMCKKYFIKKKTNKTLEFV